MSLPESPDHPDTDHANADRQPTHSGEASGENRTAPASAPPAADGEDAVANSYSPRGGWIAPSDEDVAQGRVKRVPMDAREVSEAWTAGGVIAGKEIPVIKLGNRPKTQPVEFRNCHIRQLKLQGTTFQAPVVFKYCVIEYVDLAKAHFESDLVFDSCEFRASRTQLKRFRVDGKMALRTTTICGKFGMHDAKLGSVFDAWDSTFEGWADFGNVEFAQDADFRSVDCDEGLVFTRCTFQASALFRGTSVAKKFAMVAGTLVEGCLDLQKARLHAYSYLDEVELGENACVSVWNCTPQALLLRPDQLEERISPLRRREGQPSKRSPEALVQRLPAGTERTVVEGVEYEFDHAKAAEEYGVLKNNYQKLNWLDEEDWAYYRFKVHKRLAGNGRSGLRGAFARHMEWLIFDVCCAYGTSPMRVLRTAAYVILFFAVFYAGVLFAMPAPAEVLLEQGADGTPALEQYTIFGIEAADKVASALLHSTSAFIFGFDSIERNVEGWPSLLLILEGMIGMLLFGLFIVSFSRKVIR